MLEVVGREYKKYFPLLSLQTCLKVGFITVLMKGINTISSNKSEADQIITEFPVVYDGSGCVEVEVSLEIDESVPPKQQTPRRGP